MIVMTMVAVVGPGPGSGAPGLLAPTTEVVGRSPAVTLYGDSLVVEAERYIVEAASALGWEPVVRAYGGTAPCDWSDELPFDLATTEPAIVVVAFSGNALTPCMTDPTTGKGFVGQ
ncbi:MAG TPA: hypothetical protein VIY72_01060, partial [Acidimicrobiales bacterium]